MHAGTAVLLKPDERQVSFKRYQAELGILDDQIMRIVDEIHAEGRWSHALVIISSDHGEGFGEHGVYFHGITGFEEIVHVPCLMVGGAVPVGRYHGMVSHRDIPPTILGAFGLIAGDPSLETLGRSMLRLRGNLGRPIRRFAVTHSARYAAGEETQQPMALISEGTYRLTLSFENNLSEIYDLASDPHELRDLSAEDSDVADELRRHLEMYRDIEGYP
jgi:arylsulfatase A-like enzyme